jgi:hypothetical protein
MDFAAVMAQINYWAVLAAAVASFVLGGLWYSPALFYRPWMRAAGLTEEQLRRGNMARIFGVSLLLQLVAAFVLAMFLGAEADMAFGASAGFLVGAFWVATAFGVVYLFERRPMSLLLINGGYNVVVYTVMGVIIGAWH